MKGLFLSKQNNMDIEMHFKEFLNLEKKKKKYSNLSIIDYNWVTNTLSFDKSCSQAPLGRSRFLPRGFWVKKGRFITEGRKTRCCLGQHSRGGAVCKDAVGKFYRVVLDGAM